MPSQKYFFIYWSLIVLLGSIVPLHMAHALRPPAYTKIEPAPGGSLTGDTITIEGYSLNHANTAEVTDLNTKKPLAVQISSPQYVKPAPSQKYPQHTQHLTFITIKLPPIPIGHQIQMQFLEEKFVWTKAEQKKQ